MLYNTVNPLSTIGDNSKYSFYNFSHNNYFKEENADEESLNKIIPDLNDGRYSTKSETINLASLILPSKSSKQIKSTSKHILGNKENIGYIVKRNEKNKNDFFKENNKDNESQKHFTVNEINRIKKKLESLNYFNLNS